MSAMEIIEGIRKLPPAEKAAVAEFIDRERKQSHAAVVMLLWVRNSEIR